MRGNVGAILQLVFFVLYGLGGAVALGFAIAFMPGENYENLVGVSALGVFTFLLFAGVIPSSEFQIQPEKFAALPVSANDIRTGLAVATFAQVRSALAVLCSVITIVAGSYALFEGGDGLWIPVWVIGSLLASVTAILGAEAVAQASNLAKNRKSKERMGLVTSLVIFSAWMAFSVVTNGQVSPDTLSRITRVSLYTPFGAIAGVGPALAGGNVFGALCALLIGGGTLYGLWWLWGRSFVKALSEPTASDVDDSPTRTSDSVLLRGQRPTVAAALRSRIWRYARRDSRMTQTLVAMPIMAVGFLAVGAVMENSPLPYFGAMLLAMAGGNLLMNALGLDGPSNWVNMVCGVNPKVLLKQYGIAYASLALPLLVPYEIVMFFILRDHAFYPYAAVAIPAIAISNLGIAFMLCVFNPFPTAKPGTPAMKDRSQQSGNAFITVFVALGGGAIPLVPGLVLSYWFFVPGMVLAYVLSIVTLVVCYSVATSRLEQRWPDIFAKVQNYV
ncbi:hypothetical protein CAQU_11330 [Corynebacterium aquilae DSM 44791]|uniref:Uncharacterized protein n=2 Tax=Corynebacterium aquilae TaxID=203263 RepID=A0A1L7CI59_9CORY|nr:hypothetical protein CAQU_11330 [Corynebacterium aquilae DSM 44791]